VFISHYNSHELS